MTLNWNNIGFVICKPDAVYLNLEKDILAFLEKNGFRILGSKYMKITPDLCQRLYWNDDYYEPAWWWTLETEFFSLGESLCVLVEKEPHHPYQSISEEINLKWKGNNKPELAQSGSIRRTFGSMNRIFNLFHSSDSTKEAKREALLFFSPEEIRHITNKGSKCELKDKNKHSLDVIDMYFRIKKRLIQASSLDVKEKQNYHDFIEKKMQQASSLSRSKRQIWLYQSLQEEYSLFYDEIRDNKLLKSITDYKRFKHINFNALVKTIGTLGLKLSKWEICLLKTTLLIPPKEYRYDR
jgi:nucleoside diphosphate kinase